MASQESLLKLAEAYRELGSLEVDIARSHDDHSPHRFNSLAHASSLVRKADCLLDAAFGNLTVDDPKLLETLQDHAKKLGGGEAS